MAQLQLFPSSVRSSFSVPVFPFCVLKYYCFQIAHLPRFRACWKLHCIIPHICHQSHQYICGEKNCHVEKFQISMHDKCGDFWNFSTCRVISNLSTWQMWRNLNFLHMWSNFRFLLMTYVWFGKCLHVQIMLFCCKIGFVAIIFSSLHCSPIFLFFIFLSYISFFLFGFRFL